MNSMHSKVAWREPTCRASCPSFRRPSINTARSTSRQLRREINWLLDEEADGVVFAMVSEILRLSSYERDSVAAAACEYVGTRGTTVISVGAESTKVALIHARHAQLVGASAVMVTPPALHRVDDEELFRALHGDRRKRGRAGHHSRRQRLRRHVALD